MTVLRAGWGPLVVRPQQGLSKVMALSVFLHLFLFLFLIFNRGFFGVHAPAFRGFQVSLVGPGSGMTVSGGVKAGTSKGLGLSKKGGKRSVPRTKKQTHSTPKQKTSKQGGAFPKGGTSTQSASPVPSIQQRRSGTSSAALSPLVRAPRRSVQAAASIQEDPEQLQEWWKRQKKRLKLPSSPQGSKPRMGFSKRTKTAKIFIKKHSIAIPPVVSRPLIVSKSVAGQGNAVLQNKGLAQVTSPSQIPLEVEDVSSRHKEEMQGTPISEGEGVENASEASASDPYGPETGAVSIQASVGLGGIGIGTAGGGGSFLFPGYLQKIDHKIRWKWAPPRVTANGDHLVIRFIIEKDGSIDQASISIEESSGNSYLDQAAMRAIVAAHPLPPLPAAYRDDLLTVFMKFIVREDS